MTYVHNSLTLVKLHDLCGNYCAVVDLKLRGVEDCHGKSVDSLN